MLRGTLGIILAGLLAANFAWPSAAQYGPLPFEAPDDFLKFVMDTARKNLTKGVLADGSHVSPETEEEKKHPLIPSLDARRIVSVGMVSGFADWCGVEWKYSNYLRLMRFERQRNLWSQKQLVYIGMMHGIALGTYSETSKKKGACPADFREDIRTVIARYWN